MPYWQSLIGVLRIYGMLHCIATSNCLLVVFFQSNIEHCLRLQVWQDAVYISSRIPTDVSITSLISFLWKRP